MTRRIVIQEGSTVGASYGIRVADLGKLFIFDDPIDDMIVYLPRISKIGGTNDFAEGFGECVIWHNRQQRRIKFMCENDVILDLTDELINRMAQNCVIVFRHLENQNWAIESCSIPELESKK